ncbi:MAG: hypothetical protein MK089_04085 [Phycisphaerales bacterium]|nr:hypothetical protein [Phycisphaerales bacterium]
MPIGQILLTIGLPALIGALFIIPAWVLPKFRYTAGIAGSALGVALGLALVVSFMAEAGVPSLPPAQKWHMLPVLACGITLLCPVIAMVDGSGEIGRWLIAIGSGGIIAWLAIFPGMDLLLQILLGVWIALSFISLSWVSHRRRGLTVNLAYTIAFTGISILCMEAKFITLTLIAGALSATSGVAFASALVAIIWTRDKEGKRRAIAIGWGGAFSLAALLPLMAFCGWAYNVGDVEPVHWLLVCSAPILLGLFELPGLHQLKHGTGFVLRITAVTIPVLLAIILLYSGAPLDGDDSGYNLNDYESAVMP